MLVRAAVDALVAAALSPTCVCCGGVLERPLDGAACEACWRRLPRLAAPWCDRCGVPLDGPERRGRGAVCHSCAAAPPLVDQARALGPYEGVLRELVHALKYDRRHSLAPALAWRLRAAHSTFLAGATALVPVPLHWRRHWTRGFNQADEIARRLGLPVWRLLRRRRATNPQAGLDRDARERNVRDAFALRRSFALRRGARMRVAGTTLVLVDDVNTTGATLDACAVILKRAGAREVRAITVARAIMGGGRCGS